jgi:hypothetical protein
MGWLSSAWNAVKGAVRNIFHGIEELVGLIIGGITSIFLFWVRKKIRIHVCILREKGGKSLATVGEVEASIERMNALLKSKYNVKVLMYGAPRIEVVEEIPPDSALGTQCSASGYGNIEYGEAGSFFASYAPNIPLVCPVTAFIVQSIKKGNEQWRGCSSGLLTNYVLLTPLGLNDDTTFAHEVGHACNLFHRKKKENLMYHGADRGTKVTKWQKWWFRASRHVNYW